MYKRIIMNTVKVHVRLKHRGAGAGTAKWVGLSGSVGDWTGAVLDLDRGDRIVYKCTVNLLLVLQHNSSLYIVMALSQDEALKLSDRSLCNLS